MVSGVVPKVRVVVLNYNGGAMVVDSLRHVVASDWPSARLEVICVDNASTDGSVEVIRSALPDVEIRRNPTNLGFPGNNTALRDLEGVEFVALVNSDAYVEPTWLRHLVDTLEADEGLGAACPKILLADRFVEVSVVAEDGGTPILLRDVVVGGQSVLGRSHTGPDTFGRRIDGRGVYEELRRSAVVRVPATGGSGDLRVGICLESRLPTTVRVDGGAGVMVSEVGPSGDVIRIDVPDQPFDVLNNVGSLVFEDGYGADRGYLERDLGQFDGPSDVFAWCGGAVLLRAAYLDDVGLFDESYFLYYEDTDLSWRGRTRGWRYRTAPHAIVRHEHSATTVKGSSLSIRQNERNRLVTVAKDGTPGQLTRQAVRYLASTASYARRDIVGPTLSGRRPSPGTVLDRTVAFGGFVRLLPKALVARRAVQRHRLVPHRVLSRTMTARPL